VPDRFDAACFDTTEFAEEVELDLGAYLDRARAVDDLDAVERILGAVVARDDPKSDVLVERGNCAVHRI
jgi:hypothetical protein